MTAAGPLRTTSLWVALAAAAGAQAEHQLPGSSIVLDAWHQIIVADVNADGRTDLVYANQDSANGDVCLARPDGTFGPAALVTDGGRPAGVADFTEDGFVDILAFKPFTGGARVLPGFGNGSFGAPIPTAGLKSVGGDPVAVGDVDLDGHLDFAWHYAGASAVYVQRGNGDGTFTAAPDVAAIGDYVLDHGLADLDGDGDLDLFALAYSEQPGTAIVSCPNSGAGQLGAAETSVISSPLLKQLAPHDFDGDGFMDFVAAGGPSTGAVAASLIRGGPEGFVLEQFIALGLPSYSGKGGPEAWVGDADSDGVADVLVATNTQATPGGQTFFLKGAGGFSFGEPVVSETDFTAPVLFVDADNDFLFTDVDADGRVDVMAYNGTDAGENFVLRLEIAYGHGDGSFDVADSVETGVGLADVVAADLDGDGITDLLASSTVGTPQLIAHLGMGDGTFAAAQEATPIHFADDVIAADFTGDGRDDALTWSSGEGGVAELRVGLGDGTFAAPSWIGHDPVRDAAVGDFDLDGLPDLATAQPILGVVTLWTGPGDGSLRAAGSLAVGPDAGGVAVADLTGDGSNDVVATHELGASMLVFGNEGALGWASPVELATNPFPHAVLGVDLDLDGRIDVAAACGSTGYQATDRAVSVHRSLGGGSFGELETWPADVAAGQMSTGDFDRDGWPDLVLATLDEPFLQEWPGDLQEIPVEILHGAAGGLPGQRVGVRSGGTPVGVAVADFDGNGHPDLAVALADQPHVRVHLSRAETWSTLGQALPSSQGVPLLTGAGEPVPDQLATITASLAPTPAVGFLIVGFDAPFASFAGGVLVPSPDAAVPIVADLPLSARWPKGIPAGTPVYLQAWFQALATGEVSASNALVTIAQ